MSGTNTYLNNFSNIRPYVRPIVTGRIHISNFPPKIKTKIRDTKTRLKHILTDNKYRKKKVSRRIHESLSTDSYMNNNNYLIDIYRIKSFTKEEMSSLLLLLQIINENSGPGKEGISTDDIKERITEQLPDGAAIVNTIERYINFLYNIQIICKKRKSFTSRGRKKTANLFSFNGNPLEGLTNEEYRELILAIGFYKNISLFSVFGYFLETKLMDMYNQKKLPIIPVQFHRRSMVNIIDEEIIYQLCYAKNRKKLVNIKYRKRDNFSEFEDKVYPLKIQESFFYGNRQSLICIALKEGEWSQHLSTIPLENIDDVKIYEKIPKEVPNNLPQYKQSTISFCLFYDTKDKKNNLIAKINNLSDNSRIETEQELKDGYQCTVKIQTTDPYSFIPFVQSNYPDIIIIDAPEKVTSRIMNNIKETLKHYE